MHAVLPSRPAPRSLALLLAPLALAAAALLAAAPADARDGVRSWHGGTRGGPAAAGAPPPAFAHRPGWGAPAWRPPAYPYYRPYPVYGVRPWGYGWVVPVLPVAAATVWIGGSPYYRWGGGWYAPLPGGGYQAVPPPPGVAEWVPPGPPDPLVTPRFGQSPVQAEVDIQDCNRLAALDPAAQADAQEFQRQVGACLDGRGYTVAPVVPPAAVPQATAPAPTLPPAPAAPLPAR